MRQAEEDDTPKQITPLRLLKFGKPELPLVISATFLSAICAFLNMSQNFFVGWLVDIVRFSDLSMRQDQLNWITFVLLAIYIADAMLALFSGVLYTIAASRCSCRLRSLVLRNMLRQDVAFFDTVRIGELLNRLSTDTEVIQSVVTSNLVGWFIPSVQVIIGFVICFWYPAPHPLRSPTPPLHSTQQTRSFFLRGSPTCTALDCRTMSDLADAQASRLAPWADPLLSSRP